MVTKDASAKKGSTKKAAAKKAAAKKAPAKKAAAKKAAAPGIEAPDIAEEAVASAAAVLAEIDIIQIHPLRVNPEDWDERTFADFGIDPLLFIQTLIPLVPPVIADAVGELEPTPNVTLGQMSDQVLALLLEA